MLKFVSQTASVLAILFTLTATGASQIVAPEDFDRAAALAAAGNIPIATALTDLITKSSGANISSGMAQNLQPLDTLMKSLGTASAQMSVNVDGRIASNDPTNRRSEYLNATVALDAPEVARALARGYTPRQIEFDTRYQDNIVRVARQPSKDDATVGDGRRIWNGIAITADKDAFLDGVAVVGSNAICSGTLVNNETVITASHCFCDGVNKEVLIGQNILTPAERISVKLDGSESFIPCDEMRSDPAKAIRRGDVAVLKLQSPTATIPRAIGNLAMVRDSAAVRAVGFGRTATNVIGFKYQINLVIASFQCDGKAVSGMPDQQIYRCEPSHELVAAGLNRDTCGGDSGGPIYAFGPDAKVYLVGVTSRAVDPLGRCGPGGIYVLLDAPPVKEWLAQKGIKIQ